MSDSEAIRVALVRAMASGTALDQSELRKEADIIRNDVRYSLGKTCELCDMPILNTFKVLTCQSCRHKQKHWWH